MPVKILVAIPVYNEQKYVTNVLKEVKRYAANVLVIDDGSTDETPALLAKLPVDVIRHARNLGYGRSIRDAFRWASCYSYDWLVTMDCDEQHEPASLPDFQRAIEEDDADILSGTRYAADSPGEDLPPADRRAINARITAMLNDRLGLRLTDAFCGYKAYRVPALWKLHLDTDGYALPMQFWVQAAAEGLVVREVPIRLIYNDMNRSFGGPLDDPEERVRHYLDVFDREVAKYPEKFAHACPCAGK